MEDNTLKAGIQVASEYNIVRISKK